ncbi:hypothetical protein AAZX31_04G133500 [Glycine max]|uniref:Uncharacterized protein n=1 Tax=Glycine max TaxID=3847 RepID=A0A0R0KD28_SOYBN|nr:hypothetical protein JHK85_010444 [Glycine max]KAG5066444.1 hypothetical protein JHK86_010175 [Glycine max]KAH1111379.1 hypothetical protein GYH30_009952 [Glycine max]KRH62978.1 hypothetical protein GLYMA_04G146100v4 [Glycine max]
MLVGAAFFGYMLALLQRRLGTIVASQDVEGAAMSGISPSPYQKFLKSVRPPSIPSYLGKDYIFTSLLHLSDNLNVTNIFLHYQLCIDADTLLKINN